MLGNDLLSRRVSPLFWFKYRKRKLTLLSETIVKLAKIVFVELECLTYVLAKGMGLGLYRWLNYSTESGHTRVRYQDVVRGSQAYKFVRVRQAKFASLGSCSSGRK